MTVNQIPLGEVATFIRGITFKPEDKIDANAPDAVVCMRTKNVQDLLDQDDLIAIPPSFVNRKEQYLDEGDILVSTANSWELVGKSCWVPKIEYKATAGGFISILRANREKTFPRYLYHWMNSSETLQKLRYCGRQTTNISNMSFELACALKLPLPPLPEQKRISAILDKADSIRRKRRTALGLFDALITGLFLDIFGSVVSAADRYPTVRLSDVTAFIDYRGISPNKQLSGVRLVTARNVKRGWFEHDPQEFIPADEYDSWMTRGMPRTGDVLFTTEGHTIGSAAKLPHFEKAAFGQRLIILQPREGINSDYLLQLILSKSFQDEVLRRSTGSAARGISSKQLAEISLPLPPIGLQLDFARRATIAEKLKIAHGTSLVEQDKLFNSLLQRAFKGEL